MVLLYAFSDLARRLGKKLEPDLFRKMGGKPSTAMLRFRDGEFDRGTKAKWLAFLSKKVGDKPPEEAEEQADHAAVDRYYDRCGDWLREHTRDQKKFKLIFEENVTYGFRRNLLGVKWPGLALNAFVALACVAALYFRLPFSVDDNVSVRLMCVLIIAACHALYFLLAVTESAAMEAARQYGRQLLLGCGTLMGDPPAVRASRSNEGKSIKRRAMEAAT